MSAHYALFSVVIALVAFFAALPAVPNLTEDNSEAVSVTAGLVAADTGSGDGAGDGGAGAGDGGAGDGAGDGGAGAGGVSGADTGAGDAGVGVGDSGTGCCGDSTADTGTGVAVGDAGSGVSTGADTGTGDAVGDSGAGCCGTTDSGAGDAVGDAGTGVSTVADAGTGDTGTGDGIGDAGAGCCGDSPSDSGDTAAISPDYGEGVSGPSPLSSCTLSVSDNSVPAGQSVTLSWTTANVSSVSINQGVGSVAFNGSQTVSPNVSTIYTLTAIGPDGIITCVGSVVVQEDPDDEVLTCDAFTASPGALTQSGVTTLIWNTSNATAVSINNGIGAVSVDGSRLVTVNTDTTFTLTAVRGSQSVTCATSIAIVPNGVVPSCDAFTVTPNRVRSGEDVVLSWNTSNATNVSINQGIGSVAVDGTRSVRLDSNTTFVLTANNGSAITSCQVTATIESGGGGGGGGGSNAPRCTLRASDTRVQSGERVTLSWNNTRTNDLILKDDRGRVIADSKKDSNINEDKDSVVVRPTRSTTYELTVIRGSKKRECTVDIQVENVSVSSTRTRDPLVAGISLSTVPYTGFDAGPFLTTLFYSLLALWALVVAYILVIRPQSASGASLNPSRSLAERTPLLGTTLPVAESHVPVDAPQNLPLASMSTSTAPQGYEAFYETMEVPGVTQEEIPAEEGDIEMLEARAHDAHALMSTDALHFIIAQSRTEKERIDLLDMVIGAAKANYPKEDGWVVINKDRILSLLK